MPPKKFTERVIINPFKNKNIGRRTGKDVKAGKIIRITDKGIENFDDYWSESDGDLSKDGAFTKPKTPSSIKPVAPLIVAPPTLKQRHQNDGASCSQSLPPAQNSKVHLKHMDQAKNALNPYKNKQIGRRTGKDIKAGKNIRKLDCGFENFSDYWSESDADSMVSVSCSSLSSKQISETDLKFHPTNNRAMIGGQSHNLSTNIFTFDSELVQVVEGMASEEGVSRSQGTSAEADKESDSQDSSSQHKSKSCEESRQTDLSHDIDDQDEIDHILTELSNKDYQVDYSQKENIYQEKGSQEKDSIIMSRIKQTEVDCNEKNTALETRHSQQKLDKDSQEDVDIEKPSGESDKAYGNQNKESQKDKREKKNKETIKILDSEEGFCPEKGIQGDSPEKSTRRDSPETGVRKDSQKEKSQKVTLSKKPENCFSDKMSSDDNQNINSEEVTFNENPENDKMSCSNSPNMDSEGASQDPTDGNSDNISCKTHTKLKILEENVNAEGKITLSNSSEVSSIHKHIQSDDNLNKSGDILPSTHEHGTLKDIEIGLAISRSGEMSCSSMHSGDIQKDLLGQESSTVQMAEVCEKLGGQEGISSVMGKRQSAEDVQSDILTNQSSKCVHIERIERSVVQNRISMHGNTYKMQVLTSNDTTERVGSAEDEDFAGRISKSSLGQEESLKEISMSVLKPDAAHLPNCKAVTQASTAMIKQAPKNVFSRPHPAASLSELTSSVSSPFVSQKSSVYMSIVGDVTGSITCHGMSAKVTPEPCFWGTRKRLSYTLSPGKIKKAGSNKDKAVVLVSHSTPLSDDCEINSGSKVKPIISALPEESHSLQTNSEAGKFLTLISGIQHEENAVAIHHLNTSFNDDDDFHIVDDSDDSDSKCTVSKKESTRSKCKFQKILVTKESTNNTSLMAKSADSMEPKSKKSTKSQNKAIKTNIVLPAKSNEKISSKDKKLKPNKRHISKNDTDAKGNKNFSFNSLLEKELCFENEQTPETCQQAAKESPQNRHVAGLEVENLKQQNSGLISLTSTVLLAVDSTVKRKRISKQLMMKRRQISDKSDDDLEPKSGTPNIRGSSLLPVDQSLTVNSTTTRDSSKTPVSKSLKLNTPEARDSFHPTVNQTLNSSFKEDEILSPLNDTLIAIKNSKPKTDSHDTNGQKANKTDFQTKVGSKKGRCGIKRNCTKKFTEEPSGRNNLIQDLEQADNNPSPSSQKISTRASVILSNSSIIKNKCAEDEIVSRKTNRKARKLRHSNQTSSVQMETEHSESATSKAGIQLPLRKENSRKRVLVCSDSNKNTHAVNMGQDLQKNIVGAIMPKTVEKKRKRNPSKKSSAIKGVSELDILTHKEEEILHKSKIADNDQLEPRTPVTPLSVIEIGDSALKSGISFYRLNHRASQSKGLTKQPRKKLAKFERESELTDCASSAAKGSCSMKTCQLQRSFPADVSCSPLTSCLVKTKGVTRGKKLRRVTISQTVLEQEINSCDGRGEESNETVLPSMSDSPVHYFQLGTPVYSQPTHDPKKKIIFPPDSIEEGLRRSRRTRVKPVEWYKNERVVYDRRKSGPVIMAVQPSKERIYLQQEQRKRMRRRQMFLARKQQQCQKSRMNKRLSTHISIPSQLDFTSSLEIPIVHPVTQEEVLVACFSPAQGAVTVGPSGDEPTPDDPFTLKLMMKQNLFTSGVLTLAPISEKPLQKVLSTAVIFVITYGKILITINRASSILETGDHFFVPKGTAYSLKNLRKEEAVLTFTNLLLDEAESISEQNSD